MSGFLTSENINNINVKNNIFSQRNDLANHSHQIWQRLLFRVNGKRVIRSFQPFTVTGILSRSVFLSSPLIQFERMTEIKQMFSPQLKMINQCWERLLSSALNQTGRCTFPLTSTVLKVAASYKSSQSSVYRSSQQFTHFIIFLF